MKNILLISGHNDIDNSLANRTIIDQLIKDYEHLQVRYLDKLYPTYKIDVETEQQALLNADVIILQFPIHWYNIPALLSTWIAEAWAYGFAYGNNTKKLQHKKIIVSFTSGSPESSYQADGVNKKPLEEYLNNLMQTIDFCGLDVQGLVYTGGMSFVDKDDHQKLKSMNDKLLLHAEKIKNLILPLTK